MYGLRNPWRFSFDRAHQRHVDRRRRPGPVRGDRLRARRGQRAANWGWNLREGNHPYNGGARPPDARDPIFERSHDAGDCAIIGGYVYRGTPIACRSSARTCSATSAPACVRAIVQKGGRVRQSAPLNLTVSELSTFGQGPKGALYAVSLGGTIYQIVPA